MHKFNFDEHTQIIKHPVQEEGESSCASEILVSLLLVAGEGFLDGEVFVEELE